MVTGSVREIALTSSQVKKRTRIVSAKIKKVKMKLAKVRDALSKI